MELTDDGTAVVAGDARIPWPSLHAVGDAAMPFAVGCWSRVQIILHEKSPFSTPMGSANPRRHQPDFTFCSLGKYFAKATLSQINQERLKPRNGSIDHPERDF
jgi:hypothetical protein